MTMCGPHRHSDGTSRRRCLRPPGDRGFTVIELLITAVLAGIIFVGMLTMYAQGLFQTRHDSSLVAANNIAQQRLEALRSVKYSDITQSNLQSSTFGGGQFGTSATPSGSTKTYAVTYNYTKPSGSTDTNAIYKQVAVTVTWPERTSQGVTSTHSTTMRTVVMNPAAMSRSSKDNPPPPPPEGYSITVAFKNYTEVTSQGVTVVYVRSSPTPVVTVTPTPIKQVPSAGSQTVKWTGLPGGMGYLYTVTCHSTYITSSSPAFHLLSNGWLKFDTNPGGS